MKEITCQQCGKVFIPESRNYNRKYCSRECYYASQVVEIPTSICPQCGKEFQWNRAHKPQKYCSYKCAGLARRKTKKIACENCGDTFEINWQGSERKYCSYECSVEARDTREPVGCQFCGNEFLLRKAKRDDPDLGKYCSVECRGKAMRTRVKRTCEVCGEEFVTIPSEIERRGGRYCSKACFFLSDSFNGHGNAKGGKREDLGDTYFRSSWEANYARLLNHLQQMYAVKDWEFEPDFFELQGIDNYLPDFKVTGMDGRVAYHETKGYMDDESQARLDAMAEQYPDTPIVLIDADRYGVLEDIYAPRIENWEVY